MPSFDDWLDYLKKVPQRFQTQEALDIQLSKAHQLAVRAGLYDAAEAIERSLMRRHS